MRVSLHDHDGPDPIGPVAAVPTDRLTWIGLAVAAAGWALLVGTMLTGDAPLRSGSLVAVLSVRSDFVTLAQTAIVSGFGLALVGGLRSGFGTLNRFFAAALQRSGAPRPVAVAVPVEPDEIEPAAAPLVPARERFAPAPKKVKHNYVIRPDGSVEVETLLGTRIFATMEEASGFIH